MKIPEDSPIMAALWKHGQPVYADELEGKWRVEWWFKQHRKEIKDGDGVNVIRMLGREWRVLEFSITYEPTGLSGHVKNLQYKKHGIVDELRRVVLSDADKGNKGYIINVGIIGKLYWRGKFKGYFWMTKGAEDGIS